MWGRINYNNHGLLDLNHGTLDGKSILNGMVEMRRQADRGEKTHQNGQFVLMIVNGTDQKTRLALVPNPLWNSTLNQLFHLGAYDQDHSNLSLIIIPPLAFIRFCHKIHFVEKQS